jgi:hypothetical protein
MLLEREREEEGTSTAAAIIGTAKYPKVATSSDS